MVNCGRDCKCGQGSPVRDKPGWQCKTRNALAALLNANPEGHNQYTASGQHVTDLKSLSEASIHPDLTPAHIDAVVAGIGAKMSSTHTKEAAKALGINRPLGSKAAALDAIRTKIQGRKGAFARADIGGFGGADHEAATRKQAELRPDTMAALPHAKALVIEHGGTRNVLAAVLNAWTDAARAAADAARLKSHDAHSGARMGGDARATKASGRALRFAEEANGRAHRGEDCVGQHMEAAAAHEGAARALAKAGKPTLAALSRDAAKAHRDATGTYNADAGNEVTNVNNPLADLLDNARFIKHPQHGRFMSPKGPVVGEHAATGYAKAHAFEGKETPEEEALEGHELSAADKMSAVAKNQCAMTKNAWTDEAREAAAAARGASAAASSIGTGQFPQGKLALQLSAKSGDDKSLHSQVAAAHKEAAAKHFEQAGNPLARKDVEMKAFKLHKAASDAHAKVAGMVGNAAGGFSSDDQRNAFFGLLRSGKGGEAGKAAGAKSDAAHVATDALSTAAEQRSGIAKKVNRDRQPGEHAKAQAAHQEAAKAHWAAAKGTNDKYLKGQHELAAKHHFAMAKEHGTKASTTTNEEKTVDFNRDQVLDALTANCESAQDAAALNQLSDSALQLIINAKAPGTGADLTAGSDKPERVGAAPGKDRDENDEDWSDDSESAAGKKAPAQGVSTPAMNEDDEDEGDEVEEDEGMAQNQRGRKLMSFDELLTNVDQETRESLLVGREAARREKRALVFNLLQHVPNGEARNKLGSKLFKLPKAELEERLLLVPQVHNRRGAERPAPSYAGRGGAEVLNFSASQADTDDVLPILTINDIPDPHRPKGQRPQQQTTA